MVNTFHFHYRLAQEDMVATTRLIHCRKSTVSFGSVGQWSYIHGAYLVNM